MNSWPTVITTPLNRITPLPGKVLITTDCSVLDGLSLGSVKPKSAAANVRAVSSTAVSVASAPAGASLTGVTLAKLNMAVDVALSVSEMVYVALGTAPL